MVIHGLFEELGWLRWTESKGAALLQVYTSGTGTQLRNSRLKTIKAWFCKAKGLPPARTAAWHGRARKEQSPRAAARHRAKENSCVSPISSALVALMSHLVCKHTTIPRCSVQRRNAFCDRNHHGYNAQKKKSHKISWLAKLTLPFPFHRPTDEATYA